MTDATKSTNPAQGSAMPKPSETHSKRICTIVGFSAVALGAVTLLALPRIKGGWIGLMYALQVTDRDQRLHTADAAD